VGKNAVGEGWLVVEFDRLDLVVPEENTRERLEAEYFWMVIEVANDAGAWEFEVGDIEAFPASGPEPGEGMLPSDRGEKDSSVRPGDSISD
jgi:hypothetical protein